MWHSFFPSLNSCVEWHQKNDEQSDVGIFVYVLNIKPDTNNIQVRYIQYPSLSILAMMIIKEFFCESNCTAQ